MFRNLYHIEGFREYNFNDSTGFLQRVPDPAHDVEVAFRVMPPYSSDPYLFSTLARTLSARCCAGFLADNPGLPATLRDYYLSKL